MAKKKVYDNDSISSLKGADRVRKRPGVIFGSDGLEGCEHAVFEILSNAIDEAREGHGRVITVTRYNDRSIQVEDMGRGCPVDWNEKEQRYNWELVFCELYAGGKYDGTGDGNYEYALGLNGLGSCATQYSSEYMDVEVLRDGKRYNLHFEKGENIGGLKAEPYTGRQTGTRIRWKPDLEVFTDIAIPREYYTDVLKRQAVVNPGVEFLLRDQQEKGFAEADPTADVDGFDAAAKIAILASIAFNSRVTIDDVHTEGIRNVTTMDLDAARDMGYCVKLLALAFICGAGYIVWALLMKNNPVSRIAIFGFVNPVVNVLLSAVLNGEPLFRWQYLAALVFVCVGIWLVNKAPAKKEEQ